MKVAKSRDLGIRATPMHDESVDIVKITLCFKLFGKPMSIVNTTFYWPCLSTVTDVLLACNLHLAQYYAGKGRQQPHACMLLQLVQILQQDVGAAHVVCAL